jgi:uncharacterized protein YjbI with pentapeptide repeats
MADKKQLQILARGVKTWNAWRKRSRAQPDLRGALLIDRELRGLDLSGANLQRAILRGTTLSRANLAGAQLQRADLRATSLRRARLDRADLTGAILRFASLAETSVEGASFEGCEIYGIGAWNLKGTPRTQANLSVRASAGEPAIKVDDLEVAQFVYLLLNNEKVKQVVDTVGKTAVLILGRFSAQRKAVLAAVKEELRRCGYLPMLIDFEGPQGRDLTETVTTLARMSRFIVADITDPKSIPQELATIVPDLPSVPVAPLLLAGERPYAMFEHLQRYGWVLPVVRYKDTAELLLKLRKAVIDKAEKKAQRQTRRPPSRA